MSRGQRIESVAARPRKRRRPPAVVASWQRCERLGLDRSSTRRAPRVAAADLERRLDASRTLVDCARTHLAWLSSHLQTRHVAYVTDADGVVLLSEGDARWQRTFGLAPGNQWSEALMGTSGAGLALVSGSSALVVGDDHYLIAFKDCTCVAAAIHDAFGKVIGALDVSTAVGDGDVGERARLVAYVARMIERDYALAEEDSSRHYGARYVELAEAMPQMVYVLDAELNAEYVNGKWREYTGRDTALYTDVEAAVHPEDLPGLVEQWQTARRHEGPIAAEFRLRRSDGEYRWFLTRAVPARDDEGRVVRWYGTSINIDFQKRNAEALRHAHAALQEANRRKDVFLATLAHELRNPLAPLRTGIELLSKSRAGKPDERTLAMMKRQVDHLVRLIDDLLDVARIAAGKVELQRSRFPIGAVIARAVEECRGAVEAHRHRLVVEPSVGDDLSVDGDIVRLTQVFTNLINNAIRYTPPGGDIRIRIERQDELVAVHVADNGAGIPAEMLTDIFDPFVQIEGGGHRRTGGLGIGLSLVRSLVALHGGSVQATSAGAGQGSDFCVRLPLVPASVMLCAESSREPPLAPRLRVLICDDNADAGQSLGDLLRALGASVQVVGSGTAAIEASEAYRPHLLLLDLAMPGMNGYEVAEALGRRPSLRSAMRIVALSGWGQHEHRERTRAAGFDAHLLKPVEIGEVVRLMGEIAQGEGATDAGESS